MREYLFKGHGRRLKCFLTGGHKYLDSRAEIELIPDDVHHVIVHNNCYKCGEPTFLLVKISDLHFFAK